MKPGLRRLCAVVSLILATGAAAGCAETNKYVAGKRPDVQALESTLKVGLSTPAEVRSVLGEPIGKGRTLLPVFHDRARETWSYYYEEGEFELRGQSIWADAYRTFLFVYFDKGHYDGYLWFSSFPDVQRP